MERCGGSVTARALLLPRGARARARVEAGIQRPWPADKVERGGIDRLIPYAKNARTHTPAQIAAIAASIKEAPHSTGSGSREERDRLLAEAEVILGGWPFPLALCARAPRLKWL